MNRRMTISAAVAVLLAATSEVVLISGGGWLFAVAGAVCVTALAGSLTRLSPLPAAAGGAVCVLLACAPLFTVPHWYGPAIAVGLAACCAARAARPRPLQAFANLATPLAALLLYLTAVYANRQAFLQVVPTARSLRHLWLLASHAWALRQYAPPVPARPGVVLLAAAAIGLVAIAVDLVAVRLRRPALAGIGLLVLFLAPITTNAPMDGVPSVLAFGLAGAGYLAMLGADGRYRMRAFGHVVSVWHTSTADEPAGSPNVKALAASGRRIGLVAVCVAVALPLLLPTLHFRKPPAPNQPGAGTGVVTFPDPLVQLRGLLTQRRIGTVLTYTTTSPNPAYQYLQIYVDNYVQATNSWRLVAPASTVNVGTGKLLRAPGLAPSTAVRQITTTVRLGEVAGYSSTKLEDFLPLPYPPARLKLPGLWNEDPATLMIYGKPGGLAGLRYRVVSDEPLPTAGLLSEPQQPAADARQFTGFQSAVSSQLRAIALQVTRHARSAFAKAEALQRWFLSPRFSYSVRSDLPDTPRGLLDFLTTSRTGFCQQFAFAMAALARLLGIPARVAIGFTGGTHISGDRWRVTTSDAHAWPELYFTSAGWLRFEPTPIGGPGGGQGTAQAAPLPGSQGPGGGTVSPGGATSQPRKDTTPPQVRKGVNGAAGSGPAIRAAARAARQASRGSRLPLEVLAGLLLAAAVMPGTARILVRRRRWRTAAGDAALARAAYLELRDDLGNFGFASRPSETPRSVARRAAAESGLAEPASLAMSRIARVVERARYAPAPAAADSVRADVAIVRRGLARSASLRARCLAVLMPASVLRPAWAAVRDRLQAVGWADRPGIWRTRGAGAG